MNKFLYLLMLLCLVIACSDDGHFNEDEDKTEFSFWEQSHQKLLGVNGAVKQVTENLYALPGEIAVDPSVLLDMKFDVNGLITYYNATGIEEVRAENRSVWQYMAYYNYQYDEEGRLQQIIVTPVGDIPVIYNLAYSEHVNYVPLIFPLGPFEFFPIKGLQRISTETGNTVYEYIDGKAVYRQETWEGDSEIEYKYMVNSNYPSQKTVTNSRNGEILSLETTLYTYDDTGALLKTDIKTQEYAGNGLVETGRTITRYLAGRYPLISSSKKDLSGSMFDWTYTYDSENRLQNIVYTERKGSEDELNMVETYSYISTDQEGNWIDSWQQQSSLVNWIHTDGKVGVRRNIIYW